MSDNTIQYHPTSGLKQILHFNCLRYESTISNIHRVAKFVLLSFRTFYSRKKMFLQLAFANFVTSFSCYGCNCKITFQPLFKQQLMILSQFKYWSCQIIGNHSLPDNCNASDWFRKPVCRIRRGKAHRSNSHAFTLNKQ